MKRFRILSLLLALALTVSMAAGVHAEETDDGTVEITLNAGEYGYYEDCFEKYVSYREGELFRPEEFVPLPKADWFAFDGWFTGMQGRGEPYTAGTQVDGRYDRLYANWKPVRENVPAMEEDVVYPLAVSTGELYRFTPSETDRYDICTTGNDPEGGIPNIRLLDADLREIAQASQLDYDFNMVICEELAAGTDYYIEFGGTFGYYMEYNAIVTKAETVSVTFHANPENPGEAYFDGDPEKTEKAVEVRKGSHIQSFSAAECGLETAPGSHLNLVGWSLSPSATDNKETIIADGPVDVYAVYERFKTVILDANGGYFPMIGNAEEYENTYRAGWPFSADFDPVTDDDARMFSGWATTKDAEVPDVPEGAYYEDLGERLYAVYGEKIKVTLDAAGGNFYGNPEWETYETYYGKGHVFYQFYVSHSDPQMSLVGWRDQDGNVIPAGKDTDPTYQYMKDTQLTALWARYVLVDANGGCFRFDENLVRLWLALPVYEPFETGQIVELVGEPINFDDLQYLAGWALDPGAAEPDVIEGEANAMDLDAIYAVWKEDRYYILDGEDQDWLKGSAEGLTVTVKRIGDDSMTSPCFRGVTVDGETVEYPDFNRKDGSLILTLMPEYLEGLKTGEHTIRIGFTADAFVETAFTVREADTTPETGDGGNAALWVVLAGSAAAGLALAARKRRYGA